MASTYKPYDALVYAKNFIKGMPVDDPKVAAAILDDVSKIMWMAAPWRWTLGSLPVLTLTAGSSDYVVSPFPSDFMFLQRAYISDGSTAPRNLQVEASLPTTVTQTGQPTRIAYVGSNTVRAYPKPVEVASGQTIVSLYKKQSPNITPASMYTGGVQVFDDEWFWVFREGTLWRAYLYADDSRAGNITFADGKVQYTGQRAVFEEGLEFMRSKEPEPSFAEEGKE